MEMLRARFFSQRDAVMVFFIAAIFVFSVVYSVYSTTVSTNVSVDGTLTVSGNSVFEHVYASSTVQATGNILAYASLGVATTSPTTTVGIVGSTYLTGGLGVGFATTGAGALRTTGFGVIGGRLGVVGSTTPHQELGVEGDAAFSSNATTTLSLESTGSAGGCIELKTSGAAGSGNMRWVRIYAGSGHGTTTVATAAGFGLVIEEGRCQ